MNQESSKHDTGMTRSIERVHEALREGCRVTTDSRDTREGDIFIALPGERHDGNTFAGEAIERGARLAVVNETAGKGERFVTVPDTTRFLQLLARHNRRYLGIPILAITGTNGKTTTKELCRAILSRKFNTVATRGNLNNHIGVPLTILDMNASTSLGIVEMGANHPGEIKVSCDIAGPTHGMITNIGVAHLEGFGSRERIIDAKGELYDFIRTRGGTLFVNARDELLSRLSRGIPTITYGGEVTGQYPFLSCDAGTPARRLHARTRLVGDYNLDNVAAAIAVGTCFDVDPIEITRAIEEYVPSNMRSQLVETARNTIVADAYNANPTSARAAITHFAGMPGKNKTIILGEMLELGERSIEEHDGLLRWIAGVCPCSLLLVGRSFEPLKKGYPRARWFPDARALASYLRRVPLDSSLVLLKGSRGNKLEQLIEYL